MFKFLRTGVTHDVPAPSVTPDSVSPHSILSQTNIKRELIRVVLKDTLRLKGIPYDWLGCEIIAIPRGAEEELHIQLVLMKWHESFMRYAPALEKQLLRGLDRFDPTVDHSKYIISWRFSPDCGCPFSVMPPPMFWSHSEAPEAVAEVAPAILDRRHARRPADAPVHVNNDTRHPEPPRHEEDYQSTQLSPFRETPLAAQEAPAIMDRRHARRPSDAPVHIHDDAEHPEPPRNEGDYQSTQLSPFR